MGVDLVFDDELLGLAAADVGLGLVVRNDQLNHAIVDAARLIDPVHGHLGANQGRFASRLGCPRQRLERTDLVGLRLPERLTPRRRDQQGSTERPGRHRPKPEDAPPVWSCRSTTSPVPMVRFAKARP